MDLIDAIERDNERLAEVRAFLAHVRAPQSVSPPEDWLALSRNVVYAMYGLWRFSFVGGSVLKLLAFDTHFRRAAPDLLLWIRDDGGLDYWPIALTGEGEKLMNGAGYKR